MDIQPLTWAHAADILVRLLCVRQEDGAGRVSFAIAATDDEDALTILETLQKRGAPDVKSVRIEEE
jgi:hypothetical protein